jgi:hypothetical protein
MSNKIKEKHKKYSSSESELDDKITFTKIKKIYKCGICNKKIKNYCKCINNSNIIPHSGSNIITILTNPDNENQNKQKCEKGLTGEKGEKGLTGSMGLQGNSFIFFISNNQINSGDFISIGYSDKEFEKSCISLPYEFYIKQISFNIRNQLKSKCTIILYVNNKPSDYIISICEGTLITKSFNSIVKIKPTDLFCFKINFESGILSIGVSITLVIN